MKILHVVEPFATGVLSFIQELTRYQVTECDVYVAYGVRNGTPENVESLFDSRVYMIRVKNFHGAIGSLVNPFSYLEIRRIFNKVEPDIVHLHSSASGFIGRIVIPCKRTKVFYTPHGYSFLSDDLSKFKKKIFFAIERISAKKRSMTIACSKREYDDALKVSKNATYVNNGVDLNFLSKYDTPLDLSSRKVVVCTSGRIIHQKGPEFFNEIAQKLPDIDFVWIGDGEMRDALNSPNINITGWKTREETLSIVGNSTMFILTSFGEGLSVSLLEAMGLHRICMVRNVRGCSDVISNGGNGFLCDEVDDFVQNIKNVIKDSKLGYTIAENGYNDVVNNYNGALMVRKYSEIYKQEI